MRQQSDQYLRRQKSVNHPEKDDLIHRFFTLSFNRINVEQFIFFRYLKDLIFSSGLFFVLFSEVKITCINTNNNPNQVIGELSLSKHVSK